MPNELLQSDNLQSSPALQGERIAFTGTLASMTHAQAAALAEQHGGTAAEHVSRQTTMLVVGEEGWPLEDDGRPSVKLQQVEKLQHEGIDIRIVNESDWLLLLGLAEHREEIRRLYTPAMLCQLLEVTVHVIRGWERAGLIRPVKKVFRLPYFDFQEVTSARRLSQLLEAGVPRKEIEQSLRHLPSVARGDQRPLEQLDILARNAHVVVRDAHGLKVPTTGQRVFDFEPVSEPGQEPSADEEVSEPASISIESARPQDLWTSGDWFGQGCRLYDDGRLSDAAEAFRLCLMTDAQNPEKHFHLAECLYRMDNAPGALERYYVAVELDRNYLEAWTQIGCLHRELGELDSALTAFEIALDVHPDYPDAHFHKAETLSDLRRTADAVPHWRRYLLYDSRGPWAEMARQRLRESELALTE